MTANHDIYVVLTGTGTAFSGLIKWFTKAELNHASIAFDSELREVYSFGRKKAYNPFIAGLIREDFIHPFYNRADCAIYRLRVSKAEYEKMYNHVKGMMEHQDRYKYHLLGLIGVLLNVKIDREDAYFCSHFVASVFEESAVHPVAKPSCFVTPEDFADSLYAHKIFSGKLSYYMRRTHGMTVHTSGGHTSGVHTSGVHTSGVHTSGVHTSGVHTSGVHPSGSAVPASVAARLMRLQDERAEEVV